MTQALPLKGIPVLRIGDRLKPLAVKKSLKRQRKAKRVPSPNKDASGSLPVVRESEASSGNKHFTGTQPEMVTSHSLPFPYQKNPSFTETDAGIRNTIKPVDVSRVQNTVMVRNS